MVNILYMEHMGIPNYKHIYGWCKKPTVPLWKIWKAFGILIPNIWTGKSHVPNHQPDIMHHICAISMFIIVYYQLSDYPIPQSKSIITDWAQWAQCAKSQVVRLRAWTLTQRSCRKLPAFLLRQDLQKTVDGVNGNFRILKWRYLPYIRPM